MHDVHRQVGVAKYLVISVALIALALVCRTVVAFSVGLFPISGVVFGACAYLFARENPGNWLNYQRWFSIMFVGGLLSVILFLRHRNHVSSLDMEWPRAWPYPDHLLSRFHEALSVAIGEMTIDAEYYWVDVLLTITALLLSGALGWAIGRQSNVGST